MTNVTFDMNCIVDLEEARPAAQHLGTIIQMRHHQIHLRVVGISASERIRGGGRYATNFSEFQAKIVAVGLGEAEILKPICRLDMTFYGWCIMPDGQMVDLERRIHEVLFPHIEFEYEDYCRARGIDPNSGAIDSRWRNPRCDVLALWSHMHYGDGIFVTSDENFHKGTKKPALIALGAGDILTPADALTRLTAGGRP
jgi:hypothetical protein